MATTPAVFTKFEGVVTKTNAETLRAYLKWQLVHGFAGALDSATYLADFDLVGKKVMGQQEPELRWKRCVRSTTGALGEALGKVWVQTNFPGNSKDIASSAIGSLSARPRDADDKREPRRDEELPRKCKFHVIERYKPRPVLP